MCKEIINGLIIVGESVAGYTKEINENTPIIEVPDGVIDIGHSAFKSCPCGYIDLPDSVTSISDRAFKMSSLIEIDIPNSVDKLGGKVFMDCTDLISVSLPDNIIGIQISCFSGCSSLESIKIPKSVIAIGAYAFSRCRSLNSIEFDPRCSIRVIEQNAFRECGFEKITIPSQNSKQYLTIESLAFCDCKNLKLITVLGDLGFIEKCF